MLDTRPIRQLDNSALFRGAQGHVLYSDNGRGESPKLVKALILTFWSSSFVWFSTTTCTFKKLASAPLAHSRKTLVSSLPRSSNGCSATWSLYRKRTSTFYNVVGTLAGAVGRALSNPAYVETLMPPLTLRWSKLNNDDLDLIPLLEVRCHHFTFPLCSSMHSSVSRQ